MSFLLLGIDSLIAGVAIGALVDKRSRLWLAGLFGLADGLAFLIGAGLGWGLFSQTTSEVRGGGGARGPRVLPPGRRRRDEARRRRLGPCGCVPIVLTVDNLTYGLAGEHGGALAGQAVATGAVERAARLRGARDRRLAAARASGRAERCRPPSRRSGVAVRGRCALRRRLIGGYAVELAAALMRPASSTSMRTP